MSTSGGKGPAGSDQVATAHLVAADMLTLFTAPALVIAAPGAGRMLVPSLLIAEWKPGVGSYELLSPPALAYGADLTNGLVMTPGTNAGTTTTPNVSIGDGASAAIPMAYNPNRTVVDNQPLRLAVPHNTGTPPPGNPIFRGPIVTATIAAAGTGYALNDTGTIDFDGIAAYKITGVGALGIVTAFIITNPSNGYDTISNPITTTTGGGQPGAGINFTVNVTAIPAADGDLYVTCYYTTLALH